MSKPKTRPSFSHHERDRAHELLGIRVAHMMGRKFEEGDWSYVYCRAKGIPERGWSNLNIDVVYKNLGIEHKMLCYSSKSTIAEAFGTTLMHPSATRSIRFPSLDSDPNEAMRDILMQYGQLIQTRRAKVEEQNTTGEAAEVRTGWLLWQVSLRQFLYFEELMIEPDPELYTAEWVEHQLRNTSRKGSKNLWVYDKASGKKRYSITTSAGAKIQPYFDVPSPDDPNVHLFTVIGEQFVFGQIRVWLTKSTAKELEHRIGSLEIDAVSDVILRVIERIEGRELGSTQVEEKGVGLIVREDAYIALAEALPGVNDEHCFQLLLEQL